LLGSGEGERKRSRKQKDLHALDRAAKQSVMEDVSVFPTVCTAMAAINLAGFSLALAGFARGDFAIEFRGPAAGNTQRLPLCADKVFCEQYDLADVVGIVRKLAVDGLENGVRFAANGDGAGEVGVGERLQRAKEANPAGFPHGQQRSACGGRLFEFGVAIAVGLFAVGGQEIGPARAHVAGHVLDDDRDGIGLDVDGSKEVLIGDLGDGAIGQLLVISEEGQGVFEIRGGEFERHGRILARKKDEPQAAHG
jgi:hypothetical protein